MIPRLLVLLGLMVSGPAMFCTAALADGSEAGAQYSCDNTTHTFQLLPMVRWSSDPSEGIKLKPGFKEVVRTKRLSSGKNMESDKSRISCRLGWHTLHAVINVYLPSEGMCMGGGKVSVESLRTRHTELWTPEALAWECDPAKAALMSVGVTDAEDSMTIERCYGHTASIDAVKLDDCKSEKYPIPARVDSEHTEK